MAEHGLPRSAARRTPPGVIAARSVFALAGAAVLTGSGVAWYGVHKLDSGVQTVDTSNVHLANGAPAPKHTGLDKSVNVLLVGLDSRYAMNGDPLPDAVVHDQLHAGSASDLLGGENANSEIILHIPAGNGTPTAVSIPRDDWVDAQDGYGDSMGTMKVKEAYGNAYANATAKAANAGTHDTHELAKIGHAAGIKAQIATLENLLDIPIDHFAEVNLMGFYDVAGDVGPVQVCLKRPTKDENSGADFPAGVFTLDTQTKALAFVREREDLPNGDLDRTHRQQAYITAVLKKLKDDGVLSDLTKMDALIGTAEKDVITDSGWNLLDFAGNASSLSDGGTSFRTAPIITDSSWKWIGKNHEVGNEIDIPTVRAFVQNAFAGSDATAPAPTAATGGSPTPAPSASSTPPPHVTGAVEVVNASGVNGAAAKEAAALTPLGLTAAVDGTIHPYHQHTTVLYGSGADAAAQAVATQLGGDVTPTAGTTLKAGTVEVVIGMDKGDAIVSGKLSTNASTPATQGSTSSSASTTPPGSSTATSSGNGENGGTIAGNSPDSVNGIPCIN